MNKLLVLLVGLALGFAGASLSNNYVFKERVIVATLADGGEYIGTLVDGKLSGKGEITWGNGTSYKGMFSQGQAEGYGTLQYGNGGVYQGLFENGLMSGNGEYKKGDEHYKGGFRNDMFNGYGVYEMVGGDRYSGQFENGEFHGNGEYRTESGNTYSGQFIEGVFTGQGSYHDSDGSRYTGVFADWVFNGSGILVKPNGDQYSGEFSDGSLNGQGQFIGNDGTQYKGSFKYNFYNGEGELRTVDGDVYEGEFRYGQYHGRGALTYSDAREDSTILKGVWKGGELAIPDNDIEYKTSATLAEELLYNQHSLLDASIGALNQNQPDEIDLYFFGVAGHGSEAVFRRELLYAKTYFDEKLNTFGKSLALINSRDTTSDYPLATQTSIERSLNAMANHMDSEQDILFVFLTSHGSDEFDFSIDQPGLSLNDLTASQFASIIKALPVKWKVIVVSSCYSGGHIKHLADDYTMVITAAAADKKSFGCNDSNDFTYFGEAFFKDALPASVSFIDAFDRAHEIVKQRESEAGYELSNPQISKPAAVVNHLAQWWKTQSAMRMQANH